MKLYGISYTFLLGRIGCALLFSHVASVRIGATNVLLSFEFTTYDETHLGSFKDIQIQSGGIDFGPQQQNLAATNGEFGPYSALVGGDFSAYWFYDGDPGIRFPAYLDFQGATNGIVPGSTSGAVVVQILLDPVRIPIDPTPPPPPPPPPGVFDDVQASFAAGKNYVYIILLVLVGVSVFRLASKKGLR
jgi:hypothetical protein